MPSDLSKYALTLTSAELSDLGQTARRELKIGSEPNSIVEELVASGWNPEFTRWYVSEASATSEEFRLDLTFSAYPRLDPKAEPEITAEDLILVANAYHTLNISGAIWLAGCLIWWAAGGFSGVWPIVSYATGITASVLTLKDAIRVRRKLKLGGGTTLVFAVLAVGIPCGFPLLIVLLGDRLTRFFKRANIEVGFMGPRRSSLDDAIAVREARDFPGP